MIKVSRREFLNRSALGSLAISMKGLDMVCHGLAAAPVAANEAGGSLSETLSLLFIGSGASGATPDGFPTDINQLLTGQYRGVSSLLVNGSVLIDCGPTVPNALAMLDVDVNAITDILITHSHGDHFNVDAIRSVQAQRPDKKINLWMHRIAAEHSTWAADTGCRVRPISELTPFRVKGLEVTPVQANHFQAVTREVCLHYVLHSQNKTLLYALDGAWLTTETFNIVRRIKLDAIIWDATLGDSHAESRSLFSHNNLAMIRLMNQNLFGTGALQQDATIIVSHLGRSAASGHPPHSVLVQSLKHEGMLAAHDGFKITL